MASRRITVYKSLDDQRHRREGRVVLVGETLSETLTAVSTKFQCKIGELLFLSGGLVDNISLIRDDDILLAVAASELLNDHEIATPPSPPLQLSDLPEDQLPSPSLFPPNGVELRDKEHSSNSMDPTSFFLRKCSTLLSPDASSRHDWVRLNVGGKIFATSRATLTSDPSSMLTRMFESDWFSATDDSGAYLFDRSPEYFEPLLNFLRHGKLILNEGINPQGVLEEAKFFNITKALEPLEALIKSDELSSAGHITRKEFLLMIINCSSSSILRCQGINLEGVDLSNLDLRNINFKCANLRRCNLSYSDLTNCVLERADLSNAILENTTLQCVHMPRVNMEGACLKGCSMDERLGVSTNLEGANLKSAIFDNSQMNGVNLRLSSLKGASLRSCNLRYAIMAGTDLENSDLRGCDLQHANLRGANLAGVNFDGIIAPLHMSQTVNVNVAAQSQSQLQPLQARPLDLSQNLVVGPSDNTNN